MMNVMLAELPASVYRHKYFYQIAHYLILPQKYRNISSCIVICLFLLMSSKLESNGCRMRDVMNARWTVQ